MQIKEAKQADIPALARLWHEGWHDGHGAFSPLALVAARTEASFAERLAGALPEIFVLGEADIPDAPPAGFFLLRGDELYQFYVARQMRGTGAAMTLMAAAEAELLRRGITRPWLACAIGNDRAARFYEKAGWRNVGMRPYGSVTKDGPVEVMVWRFERAPSR